MRKKASVGISWRYSWFVMRAASGSVLGGGEVES